MAISGNITKIAKQDLSYIWWLQYWPKQKKPILWIHSSVSSNIFLANIFLLLLLLNSDLLLVPLPVPENGEDVLTGPGAKPSLWLRSQNQKSGGIKLQRNIRPRSSFSQESRYASIEAVIQLAVASGQVSLQQACRFGSRTELKLRADVKTPQSQGRSRSQGPEMTGSRRRSRSQQGKTWLHEAIIEAEARGFVHIPIVCRLHSSGKGISKLT